MFAHIYYLVQSEFPVFNLKPLFSENFSENVLWEIEIINMCTCCPPNWFKQSSSLSLCLPSLWVQRYEGWATVWKLYSVISLSFSEVFMVIFGLKMAFFQVAFSLTHTHIHLWGFFSKTYTQAYLKRAAFMHAYWRNCFMSWIIFLVCQVLWQ